MKINLITWNVRGLNDKKKREIIKSQVLNWKTNIICLHETKLEGEIKEIVSQIWGGRWVMYACLEASGTRWGILLLWDCRVWKGEMLQIGAYTLTCKFEALLQNFHCLITGVYAPNCRIERRIVWREIGAVRGLMEGPWVVCGDFNVTKYPSKKRDCSRRSSEMVGFLDFIEDMELIDLQLEGGSYTWFKADNHTTASRIDRFLISEEWDDSFRNIKQTLQQRLISDHTPVAPRCGAWEQDKSHFKFENW
nr:exodeoxyribonuclease-like [Nicotiana tomentosiformis]